MVRSRRCQRECISTEEIHVMELQVGFYESKDDRAKIIVQVKSGGVKRDDIATHAPPAVPAAGRRDSSFLRYSGADGRSAGDCAEVGSGCVVGTEGRTRMKKVALTTIEGQ